MAKIEGYYGIIGVDAVKRLAADGKLKATPQGGFGLWSAEVTYAGIGADGEHHEDMFAFKCWHGHKTRTAALTCSRKKIRELGG